MEPWKSTKRFPEALKEALVKVDLADLSMRRFAARVQERGNLDRSHATLNRIFNGTKSPILASDDESGATPDALLAIAQTLGVPPETFAEYRLWKMRCRFNPAAVGWDEAIRNLQAAEAEEEE